MVWALELLGFWGLMALAFIAPMVAALLFMTTKADDETESMGWGAGILFIFALFFSFIVSKILGRM